MNLEQLNPILVPVITGLCEGLKKLGVPTKVIPFISMGFSLAYCLFQYGVSPDNVLIGLAVGLGSVGLFSTTKNIKEIVQYDKSFEA